MADLSKVGTEYSPIIWDVERGKIRELAKVKPNFSKCFILSSTWE